MWGTEKTETLRPIDLEDPRFQTMVERLRPEQLEHFKNNVLIKFNFEEAMEALKDKWEEKQRTYCACEMFTKRVDEKTFLKSLNFGETIDEINNFIHWMCMEILVDNDPDMGILARPFKSLKDCVMQKRSIHNFQHRKLMRAIRKYYIFNPKAKVHMAFVVYYNVRRPKMATVRDVEFSRGVLYDMEKGPTAMDLVHLHVMQAIYDSNDIYPMPRMLYKKDYISNYKEDDFKLKPLKAIKRIPMMYMSTDFLVFILVGIPALFVIYLLHTMEPMKLTFFEKLIFKIYMIFSQLFPNVEFPGLDF